MRVISLFALLTACGVVPAPEAAPEPAPAADPAPVEAPTAKAGEWVESGAAFGEGEVTQLGALLDAPDAFENKAVRVEGRVSEVCQKAGCWMVISDQERHVRVRMKDHDFSVAKDGAGRTGQVRGQLVAKAIDPEEVAHFASETRDGGVVPERAAHSGKTWEIIAESVRLRVQ